MPAQIIVTRLSKADAQKKVTELGADDILEVVNAENPRISLVRCKIPVVRRGPELDRGYQALQAVADADSAIGRERQKAREAKEKAAEKAVAALPKKPAVPATAPAEPAPAPAKPGPNKPKP
jgi:hypothetical protein